MTSSLRVWVALVGFSACGPVAPPCNALAPAGQNCCPTRGADACVPGYYCGVERGRTIYACLKEGTATVMDDCPYDAACASGECRAFVDSQRRCAPGLGEPCSVFSADPRDNWPCSNSPVVSLRCDCDRPVCALNTGACGQTCRDAAECTGNRKCIDFNGNEIPAGATARCGKCSCP